MKIKVGIIGLGYWGPNYVRNFSHNPFVEVVWGCDISDAMLRKMRQEYPLITYTNNYQDLLSDSSLDCVAIATPPKSHFSLAKAFLKAGKHVFIAKPLTTTYDQAKELSQLARRKKLMLFTDLTYICTDAVRFIQRYIHAGHIGIPFYYDSVRSNLGLIQKDVNVIWDLAPHDLAILDFCFETFPKQVFVTASSHFVSAKIEEMAHITLTYPNNFIAHIQSSWLSPVKQRSIYIGGSKKMIYFNDIEQDEKIKIYNKSIETQPTQITSFTPVYRSGDITIPHISSHEALEEEISEFIKKVIQKKQDEENIERSLRIIKILEACDKSLRTGKPISVVT